MYHDKTKLLQQGEHVQLFDLDEGPREEQDLSEEDEERTAAMRDAGIDVDAETEQRFRERGYID